MSKVIAELSGNHGGDIWRCISMIKAAKWAGCWAAKFQLYRPEDLPDFDAKLNFAVPLWWLPQLFDVAQGQGIGLFASVFHPWAVHELIPFTNIFKIASPESTPIPRRTLDAIKFGIPQKSLLLASSGHANWWEIKNCFPKAEMLFCKAGYPATIDDADIKFAAHHAQGFSDHTVGIEAPLAMSAAGARYIEKHFKLDDNCVDAAFSLNPEQMKTLCDLCS